MLRRGCAVVLTILAAASLLGCAGDEEWAQANPENQGYRWVGEGEPANFGSAYSFCQRTTRLETQNERLLGGSGVINTVPGGPTTVPGFERTTPVGRDDFASRRQFSQCMESQGWARES